MSEYNQFPRCTNSRQRAGRPRQTANSNALSGFGPQGYPQAVGTSDLALGWAAYAFPICHATAPGPSAGIARCGAPLAARRAEAVRVGGNLRGTTLDRPAAGVAVRRRRTRATWPVAGGLLRRRGQARCRTTSARVSAVSLSHNRAGPASRVDRRGRRVSTREIMAIGRQRRERALNHQQRKGTIARAVTEFGQADHLAR